MPQVTFSDIFATLHQGCLTLFFQKLLPIFQITAKLTNSHFQRRSGWPYFCGQIVNFSVRRIVEAAFGQLTQRFRRFMTILEFSQKKSASLILSSIVLHNFLLHYNKHIQTDPYAISIREARNAQIRPRAENLRAQIYRERFVEYFARQKAFFQ